MSLLQNLETTTNEYNFAQAQIEIHDKKKDPELTYLYSFLLIQMTWFGPFVTN